MSVPGVFKDMLSVVHHIGIHAVENANVVLLCSAHGIGIALHHIVVGNGDGLVAPGLGLLREIVDGVGAVHIAHFRVDVQLDALFRAFVLPFLRGNHLHISRNDAFPAVETVEIVFPVNGDGLSLGKSLSKGVGFLIFYKSLHIGAVRPVVKGEDKQGFVVFYGSLVEVEDGSRNGDGLTDATVAYGRRGFKFIFSELVNFVALRLFLRRRRFDLYAVAEHRFFALDQLVQSTQFAVPVRTGAFQEIAPTGDFFEPAFDVHGEDGLFHCGVGHMKRNAAFLHDKTVTLEPSIGCGNGGL